MIILKMEKQFGGDNYEFFQAASELSKVFFVRNYNKFFLYIQVLLFLAYVRCNYLEADKQQLYKFGISVVTVMIYKFRVHNFLSLLIEGIVT